MPELLTAPQPVLLFGLVFEHVCILINWAIILMLSLATHSALTSVTDRHRRTDHAAVVTYVAIGGSGGIAFSDAT